jgi:hypothetical protein
MNNISSRYHGKCKLTPRFTVSQVGCKPALNFYCEEHDILCGKDCWELGWCYGTNSKLVWGKKYFNKYHAKKLKTKL